jgi:hypothetical protein
MEDEAFVSWLTRLAFWQKKEFLPYFYKSTFWELPRHTGSDILLGNISDEWIRRLCIVTGQPDEKVKRVISHPKWFELLNFDYRTTFSFTLQRYCPSCLEEDIKSGPFAYLRGIWSFPLMISCQKHETLLQDSCPQCQYRYNRDYAKIWQYDFSDGGDGFPLNLVCPQCNYNLMSASTTSIDPQDPVLDLMSTIRVLITDSNKKAKWGNSTLTSGEFLRTVYVLTRFLGGRYLRNLQHTKNLLPVLQQVAEWWKSWPDGFEKWLSLTTEGYKSTNEVRFRSSLRGNRLKRRKPIPSPLKKYSKRKAKKIVVAWSYKKAIEFMRDWVKKHPGKYPHGKISGLGGICSALKNGRIKTPDGKIIDNWQGFLKALRSEGIDVPLWKRPIIWKGRAVKEWRWDNAIRHLKHWTENNPDVYPTSKSKGLNGLYGTIYTKGLMHPSGIVIDSWEDFLKLARKEGLNVPKRVICYDWENALDKLTRWLKNHPGEYPGSRVLELKGLSGSLHHKGFEHPNGTFVKSWVLFLKLAKEEGLDIPPQRRSIPGRKGWTLSDALNYLDKWINSNPGKYPACNKPEFVNLARIIRTRRFKTDSGKTIRTWVAFLKYAEMKGLQIPQIVKIDWPAAVDILKEWLRKHPGEYPANDRKEFSKIRSKMRSKDGLISPERILIKSWPVFLKKAGYRFH